MYLKEILLLTQESTPSVYSIRKKHMAKTLAYGSKAIASGYMTKASPGPPVATVSTGIPVRSVRIHQKYRIRADV